MVHQPYNWLPHRCAGCGLANHVVIRMFRFAVNWKLAWDNFHNMQGKADHDWMGGVLDQAGADGSVEELYVILYGLMHYVSKGIIFH